MQARAMHGLARTLLYNMILGVTQGFGRDLEVVGVGYKAELKGKELLLSVGFSEPGLQDPRGDQDRSSRCDADQGERDLQGTGGPGGCGNPARPSSGTVQGQGDQVRRRSHPPESRKDGGRELTGRHGVRLSDRGENGMKVRAKIKNEKAYKRKRRHLRVRQRVVGTAEKPQTLRLQEREAHLCADRR